MKIIINILKKDNLPDTQINYFRVTTYKRTNYILEK